MKYEIGFTLLKKNCRYNHISRCDNSENPTYTQGIFVVIGICKAKFCPILKRCKK